MPNVFHKALPCFYAPQQSGVICKVGPQENMVSISGDTSVSAKGAASQKSKKLENTIPVQNRGTNLYLADRACHQKEIRVSRTIAGAENTENLSQRLLRWLLVGRRLQCFVGHSADRLIHKCTRTSIPQCLTVCRWLRQPPLNFGRSKLSVTDLWLLTHSEEVDTSCDNHLAMTMQAESSLNGFWSVDGEQDSLIFLDGQ